MYTVQTVWEYAKKNSSFCNCNFLIAIIRTKYSLSTSICVCHFQPV